MIHDARVQRIVNAGDARLDQYRDIRERDLVRNQRRFIAEGTTVLNVLVGQRRFAMESALILENRLAGLSGLVAAMPPDVPVYTVSSGIMDGVAGFPMHRGVLAIGMRSPDCDEPPADDAMAANWTTIIALAGLANHDNVGAVFRNAAALGADAVVMDVTTCDPLYRKALRVSVGGVLALPWHRFVTAAAMIGWLRGNGFEIVGLAPNGRHDLKDWRPASKTALLLGAEGPGLDPALLDDMASVRVPMARDFDSLNVATSAAIVLHHMRAMGA